MKIIKGNLLELLVQDELDVIVHGCNCFHVMGAGIAEQISRHFDEAAIVDVRYTERGDMSKLGSYTSVTYAYRDSEKSPVKMKTIVNLYSQYSYGRNFSRIRDKAYDDKSNVLVSYEAIEEGFRKIYENLILNSPSDDVRIGFPLIGAGLAGGDWGIISKLIDKSLERHERSYLVEYNGLGLSKESLEKIKCFNQVFYSKSPD